MDEADEVLVSAAELDELEACLQALNRAKPGSGPGADPFAALALLGKVARQATSLIRSANRRAG